MFDPKKYKNSPHSKKQKYRYVGIFHTAHYG